MKQKGLAPILIVLILAVLVGGYLVYQNQAKPTPPPQQTVQPISTPSSNTESTSSADTSNWKTYTSKLGDYSVQYPSNWTHKEAPSPYYGSTIPSFIIETDINGRPDHQLIIFNVINKLLTQETGMLRYKSTDTLKYNNITIAGYPARKVRMSGECEVGDQVIYISKGTNIYEITWHNCQGYRDTGKISIFNQILSTFKFLP